MTLTPNIAHWSFLKKWPQHCPAALTWATPNLRLRWQVSKAGLRIDSDLDHQPPEDWAADMDQTIVSGGNGFREVAFFR